MIVITAASGKLGQATARELAKVVAPKEVRLAARSIDKLADLKAKGFEVVAFDYDDPASLQRAFAGADKALIISSMGSNDDRARQHKAAFAAAEAAGVAHIVYTSATNATGPSRFEWAPGHAESEAALQAGKTPYTILRDNSYASNNDGLYRHALETGTFAVPGVDSRVAYVTHDDIAAAAAAVLTGSGHAGKTYEMTGPEALDGHQVAALLSEVTGKTIAAADMPLEAYAGMLRSFHLPEFVVSGVTSFMAALANGEYAQPSGDVARLAGRPATSLKTYLKAALAS
jgi:NAD(P)H dehydrogenase (quinone)